MELGLEGKVALVTGAHRGIGAAIARERAAEGAGSRSPDGAPLCSRRSPPPSVWPRDLGIRGFGAPEEIAGLAAFVVSARDRYLHGALIDMDGGQTRTI